MKLTLAVENYRGIRKARWQPEGVCAVVGPNACGKTTLLSLLEFFTMAFEKGVPDAINRHPGGVQMFKYQGAPTDDPVVLRLGLDGRVWEWRISWHDGKVDLPAEEQFSNAEQTVVAQLAGSSSFTYEGGSESQSGYGALRTVGERQNRTSDVGAFVDGLKRLRFRARFALEYFRSNGSQAGGDTYLSQAGENAFTVLRNWRDKRETRLRWEFVVNGLRRAFAGMFDDLEFESAGDRTFIRVRTSAGHVIGQGAVSSGLLAALLHLTAVASEERDAVVAFDELENGLHPFAISALIECFRERAREMDLTVLMATHSPAVLNAFKGFEDHLFAFEPAKGMELVPVVDGRGREWLAQFALGDLFMNGEFGSPQSTE